MQTVIYLAARTSGIPFVSSSLSASPSQKTSQFRTSLSPWLSPVPQVPSSIVTLFSQCANTGTRNRSLPRPHNPTAVPYTLGFVPHHARCLRKFALDVVTDAACAIRGRTLSIPRPQTPKHFSSNSVFVGRCRLTSRSIGLRSLQPCRYSCASPDWQ
jgi:hypothetical protein